MKWLFDSFWRAVAYCFRPDVLVFAFFPWLAVTGLTLIWGYFHWNEYLHLVRQWLVSADNINLVLAWLANNGVKLKDAFPSLLLILAGIPVVMVLVLLLISHTMTPVLVDLVRERRFIKLDARKSVSKLYHWGWSLWHTLLLFVGLAAAAPVSILIPPMGLLILPVMGGWFATHIIGFSVLALHANKAERLQIFTRYETQLFGIGVVIGYLGLIPTFIGASSAWLFSDFTVWIPLAIGAYVLITMFATLWFTHYCLYALQGLRKEQAAEIEKKAKEKVAADAKKAIEDAKKAATKAAEEAKKAADKAAEEARKAAEKAALDEAIALLSKPPPPPPPPPPPKPKWWQTIKPKVKAKITTLQTKYPTLVRKK